jgi:hypothetical protein
MENKEGEGIWSDVNQRRNYFIQNKKQKLTINRKLRENHCTLCNQANRITPPAETYRKNDKTAFGTNPPRRRCRNPKATTL